MRQPLTYSPTFDALDPDGERQAEIEGFIAAQLFVDWAEHTLFWHSCRAILLVARAFCPQEDPTLETYNGLVVTAYEFLEKWRLGLEDAAGPDEEEAAQAGRDLLILILSWLKPEYTRPKEEEEEGSRG